MDLAQGETTIDHETKRVIVRHDDRTIEVVEKAFSWDDLVLGCSLVLGLLGLVGAAAKPFTLFWLTLPFWLLFTALGGYYFWQRLRHPGVRIDRQTWRVEVHGSPHAFAGPPRAATRSSVYFAGGHPKRHWGVELRVGADNVFLANGIGSHDQAQQVVDCVNRLIRS